MDPVKLDNYCLLLYKLTSILLYKLTALVQLALVVLSHTFYLPAFWFMWPLPHSSILSSEPTSVIIPQLQTRYIWTYWTILQLLEL